MLYICTLCDSTIINKIIYVLPNCLYHVSSDDFNGGSDSYVPFWNTHESCLLNFCIPLSNGIFRLWLLPEFGAELPLDNCTPTIILINQLYIHKYRHTANLIIWTSSSHSLVTMYKSKLSIFWTIRHLVLLFSHCLNAYSNPNLQQR